MPAHNGHMPIIPEEPTPFSVSEPHKARQMAEAFGSDPERYDRSRPHYPQAMVDAIVAAIPGRDVLDVGIGTGISARPFQAAGCRVVGVDVDARMAEFARRRGFEVEVAKFEDWDAAGRRVDAVISGQTWHWVDPVAGAAKAAAILRPGGRLALFWNVFQPPVDVAEGFAAVYRRVLPGSSFARGTSGGLEAYSGLHTIAADGVRAAGLFGEPERWRFDWERSYTREEWLDQVPTSGGHNQFPPGQLEELVAGLGAVIDAVGGRFTMHYSTVVVTAVTTAEE
jgi:SAM-dependent methyltransferase